MITISAFADEIAADLDTQIDVCRRFAISCIDIRNIDGVNVSDMTPQQVAEHKKKLDAAGFTVPCIGSPLGKITMDDDFDAHMEVLSRCCDAAEGFDTNLIRVFSFYPSPGRDIADQRDEVMQRMSAMVELAERRGMVLMLENEKRLYGAGLEGTLDLFNTIKSPHMKCIFDPANFVEEGYRPYDDVWAKGVGDIVEYLHVKDKVPGQDKCVPAGMGQGQFDEIFADLKKRNWSGYATLEPHLSVAGQFDGFTGPELFGTAVESLTAMLSKYGIEHK